MYEIAKKKVIVVDVKISIPNYSLLLQLMSS